MNSNELKNLREWVDAAPVCQERSEQIYESVREKTERLGLRVSQGMAVEAARKALCACGKALQESAGTEAYAKTKQHIGLVAQEIKAAQQRLAANKKAGRSTKSLEAEIKQKQETMKNLEARLHGMNSAINKAVGS